MIYSLTLFNPTHDTPNKSLASKTCQKSFPLFDLYDLNKNMIESGYTMHLTDVEEKTRIKSSMISFKKICCHKRSM